MSTRRSSRTKLSRRSCCSLHCDRIAHSRLIQTMVAHSARLLISLDFCRHDATPLPIGVEQRLNDVLQHAGLMDSAVLWPPLLVDPRAYPSGETSSRSHLMDSEHRNGMIVQLGQSGTLKYMAFIGQFLT